LCTGEALLGILFLLLSLSNLDFYWCFDFLPLSFFPLGWLNFQSDHLKKKKPEEVFVVYSAILSIPQPEIETKMLIKKSHGRAPQPGGVTWAVSPSALGHPWWL